MAGNLESARRLLVLSSQSGTGDQDGPPDVKRVRGGALGVVRAMQKEGSWPANLDLLVLSDAYGLVEPLNLDEPPVLIPFTRIENGNWWEGFIARNVDNYIARRPYSAAFVHVKPEHEAALRASRKLRALEPEWPTSGDDSPTRLRDWIEGAEEAPTPLRLVKHDEETGSLGKTTLLYPRSTGPLVGLDEPAPSTVARAAGVPAAVAGIIEDAIYSDRFMLVLSKLGREQIAQVRLDIEAEWARRSSRRHERPSVSNIIVKQARLPWSERPAVTLYGRLLESIGMQSVLGSINKAVTQRAIMEPGRYRDILTGLPRDESQFIADLLYLLWEASSRMDKDEIAILRAYLADTCTHDELRRIGLPRNLTLEDRYDVLGSILECISGLSPEAVLSDHRRVWIHLDQIENLLGYTDYDRWALVKALETLMARTPSYLTVWLNILPTSPATAAQIQSALENSLAITNDITEGSVVNG